MLEEHLENLSALKRDSSGRLIDLSQLRLGACDQIEHGLMCAVALLPDAPGARGFQTKRLALPLPLLEQCVQGVARSRFARIHLGSLHADGRA